MSSLIGREAEIRELNRLVDAAAPTGQAIVLVGEPGIGKTALLNSARGRARAAGFQVLSATGVESETQFPFAGLHQLVRPVLGGSPRLAAAHRRALLAVFGLADGPPPELYLIALAADSLVGVAAAERPVAVLVDDVQWLDLQSQEVLAFITRRAVRHRLLIVGATRPGHPGPYLACRPKTFEVSRVTETSADEILRFRAGVASPADRARIRRQAQGNPLALLELPAVGVGLPVKAGGLVDGGPPTLTARLERAFAGRLTELPPLTRDAVLIAAVDSAPAANEIEAVTSVLSGAAGDDPLGPAAKAGLLAVTGGQVEFRHPLVRPGVLQSETLTRRMAAHAALAEVLSGEPYRRTWHRAQSIIGPDDEIADELVASAVIARRRGAVISVIADLRRAAELSSISAARGHRLLMAAKEAFALGRFELVDRLVQEAAVTDLSELDQARTQWLREILNDGVSGDAVQVLQLCARQADHASDRDLALNLLLRVARRCWWADTGPAVGARVAEAAGALADAESDPRYVAVLAMAEPVWPCAVVMDLQLRFCGMNLGADVLYMLGMAAREVGDEVGDIVRSVEFCTRAAAQGGIRLAAATGQHAAVYGEFRHRFKPADPCFHQRERYDGVMFLGDAAAAAGQRADARQDVAFREQLAAVAPALQLHVHLACARAVLADDAEAGQFSADQVAFDLSRWPWARARAVLAYRRRALRQRYRASKHLLQPLPEIFDRIGTPGWAGLARSELRLASAGPPEPSGHLPPWNDGECPPTR